MRLRRMLVALSACLVLAACGEMTSVPTDELLFGKGKAIGKQNNDRFSTGNDHHEPVPFFPHVLRQSVNAPPLQTYHVEFWAKYDAATNVRVDYEPDIYGDTTHFLFIHVPSEALLYRPDGSVVAPGDSVLIGVTIDPVLLQVNFEPHGMIFAPRKPIKLRIHYELADADYNGDGKVDRRDADIERHDMGFGYQAREGDLWFKFDPDDRSIRNKWVQLNVRHFSNYAVAW